MRTAGRHQSTVKVQSVEGQMDLLERHHAEPGVYSSLVVDTPNRTSDLRQRERGSAVPKRFNSSFAMQTADVPDIPRSSYGDSIIGGSSMGRQGIATQQAGRLSRPPLDSRALTKPTTAEGSKRPRLFDRITVNTKELTDKQSQVNDFHQNKAQTLTERPSAADAMQRTQQHFAA